MQLPESFADFLAKEEVCVIGVALPNGDVHVAPVLFYCDPKTLNIYFSTSKASEKMNWWRDGHSSARASIAVGLSRGVPYLLQMRGYISEFKQNTNEQIVREYQKVASAKDDITNPQTIMLSFKPDWARYTDRSNDNRKYKQIRLL